MEQTRSWLNICILAFTLGVGLHSITSNTDAMVFYGILLAGALTLRIILWK